MFDKGGIFGTRGLQAGPFNDQLSLAWLVSILIYGLLLLIASILDTKLIRALHATHPRCSRTAPAQQERCSGRARNRPSTAARCKSFRVS